MTLPSAEIGIFGGTGFYRFLDHLQEVAVATPFGPPSAKVAVGEMGGRTVAFLARHGVDHELPPHKVNFRANAWALRRLGVRRILAPCSVGSLQPHVKPGEFVVVDQLVDRTSGRADTFFDGPTLAHVSFADPYCPELRRALIDAGRAEGVTVHEKGTVVVIQGPRFSTRAESRWFGSAGWEVVNMTQYPEAILARELGMCYSGVALVTDYDAGLEGVEGIEPVTIEVVFEVLAENIEKV
ncbi:MAG: 5-methylthioadenosine phosphorylase, partial [Actinomycetota bacterium]|nr:5-methylthioadenosine phosphorylase [Actinomycetota bacterium]